MTTYILKRFLLMVPMLIGITLISFVMIAYAPGAAGQAGSGDVRAGKLTRQQFEVMQETFHVGQPRTMRYLYWLGVLQPELSKSRRKEWLNGKLAEFRKSGAVRPPLTRQLLEMWEKTKNKDELLAQADKDRETLLDEWLGRALEEYAQTKKAEPPLSAGLLERYGEARKAAIGAEGAALSLRPEQRSRLLRGVCGAQTEELLAQAEKQNESAGALRAASVAGMMRALGEAPPRRGLIFGDFGQSVHTPSISVAQKLKEALPVTLIMSLVAIFIVYVVSIPLGIYSATRHNRPVDQALTVVLFILYSLPSFWVAILLIRANLYLPEAYRLPFQGLFPAGAEQMTTLQWLWEVSKHLFLPMLASCYAGLAGLSRYMRVGMLDVLRQDYIRTARAKGCSEKRVIFKHALRNSVIPIVTLAAGLLPGLIGGSFIIESIFGIPGMGYLGYNALLTRDYTVLMAEFTISGVLVMLGILLSDVLYVLVDPRISFEGAQ